MIFVHVIMSFITCMNEFKQLDIDRESMKDVQTQELRLTIRDHSM